MIMKFIPIAAMAILASVKAFPQNDEAHLKQEKNKQIVITMNDLFNNNKQEEAMQYFSGDLVKMGNINGKSYFTAMQDDVLQTFPDVQTKILSLWAEGDWVIADCQFTGTHKGIATLPHHGGLLVGKAPTNRSFKVQHIRMYRLMNDKIVERKAVRDDVGMYQQLGMLPPPPAFGPK